METSTVMNVVALVQNIGAEVADIDQALAELERRLGAMTTRRAELLGKLAAVGAVLTGGAVPPAPAAEAAQEAASEPEGPRCPSTHEGEQCNQREEHAMPHHSNSGAEWLVGLRCRIGAQGLTAPAVCAKLDGHQGACVPRQPAATQPRPQDEVSDAERVRQWVAARETPFSGIDIRRAFKGMNPPYVGWLLQGMSSRREIVRVEGKRYLRADLVTSKAADEAAAPPAAAPGTEPCLDPDTEVGRVALWARAQPGSFSHKDAAAAFPDLSNGYVGVCLGSLRSRGIITRISHGLYTTAMPADGRMAAEAQPVDAEAEPAKVAA